MQSGKTGFMGELHVGPGQGGGHRGEGTKVGTLQGQVPIINLILA